MTECDKCGTPTRTLYPYLREVTTTEAAFDEHRILPRSAIAALNSALEHAIPYGEHPDDNNYGAMCEACSPHSAMNVVATGG